MNRESIFGREIKHVNRFQNLSFVERESHDNTTDAIMRISFIKLMLIISESYRSLIECISKARRSMGRVNMKYV